MSFSRHLRRHAHHVATVPRRAWRRTYSVKEERPGWPLSGIVFRTPISTDAPYTDEDARLWDWVAATLIAAIVIGLVVFGIVAWG